MSKLSISIDMGAKNNGVFIVKTNNDKIISKKATNIIVEKGSINFSKKSRRENRHKDRNYKRRKQSKRLLWEILESKKYNNAQVEHINGLLNNRGYTFLSVENEFEVLQDRTIEFIDNYFEDLKGLKSKENFEKKFDNFINDEELINFIDNTVNNITQLIEQLKIFEKIEDIRKDFKSIKEKNYNKKFKQSSYLTKIFDKYEIYYSFENEDKTITKIKLSKIKSEELVPTITKYNIDLSKIDFNKEEQILKDINELFNSFKIDIDNKYTQDVQKPNQKDIKDNFKKILELIKNDLTSHKEKPNLIDFLLNIKKEIQTGSKPRKQYLKEIKEEIEKLYFIDDKDKFYNLIGNISNLQLRVLRKFFNLHSSHKAQFNILKKYFISHHYKSDDEKQRRKNLFKILNQHNILEEFLYSCNPLLTIPPYEDMNNRDTYRCNSLLINPEYITDSLKKSIDILYGSQEFEVLHLDNLKYPQELQRILDISYKMIDKQIHPREVFKKDKGDIGFYQKLLKENFKEFSNFAKEYYILEQKAINGIFENGFLMMCNKNTPSKNNFKHILLKPLYEYDFTKEEVEKFNKKIKGLQSHIKRVSEVAKDYQNSFYHYIEACWDNQKCSNDKRIKDIVKNIDNDLKSFQNIFNELDIKTYLNKIEKIDKDNLKRVINIFKQTYEILFKDINGFSKTCKTCTIENNYRSSGDEAIAKRLLSDVAKPIDGMLDFMLDKIAFEIVEQIDSIEDEVEIILEQNRFSFEENLALIKGKKPKKREAKDILNLNICPYSGENINDTNGEYDHILPQSEEPLNSKANLIYCSSEGNKNIKKDIKKFPLEKVSKKHLKEIFKTDSLDEIKNIIQDGIKEIDIDKFTNFKNLYLKEQIALRYALFCDKNSNEFKKAKEIIKNDKLKTITNGTQKRLARLIYQKLSVKFDKKFDCNVKVIDNLLISATRKDLSYDKTTGEINELWKDKNQDSHSHCIDAMVAFYLANSYIKGGYHQKRDNLASIEPDFEFGDIYIRKQNSSEIKTRTKQWYDTTNPKYNIASKRLFDQNDIGVGYIQLEEMQTTNEKGKIEYSYKKGIVKDSFIKSNFTKKNFDYFIQDNILQKIEVNRNKTKEILYQVNKNKLYEILFDKKEEVLSNISHYKKLTKELQYTYTKVDPFDFLGKFLEPKTSDDKKAVNKIINKSLTALDDITFNNLMAWFSRSNKLDKNGAKLGYYKSWEIFTKTLIDNKNKLFKIIEKEDKKTKNKFMVIVIDKEEALEECKKTIFKQEIPKKRKVKKAYTLYTASKNDTQYIHRRKDNNGKYIYQTRIANGHNKLKGYKKAFSDDGKYFFKNSKNIIPLKIDNYKKAFEVNNANPTT